MSISEHVSPNCQISQRWWLHGKLNGKPSGFLRLQLLNKKSDVEGSEKLMKASMLCIPKCFARPRGEAANRRLGPHWVCHTQSRFRNKWFRIYERCSEITE